MKNIVEIELVKAFHNNFSILKNNVRYVNGYVKKFQVISQNSLSLI